MQTGNLPLHTAIYFAIIFTSEINGHPRIHSQVTMNFKEHVSVTNACVHNDIFQIILNADFSILKTKNRRECHSESKMLCIPILCNIN